MTDIVEILKQDAIEVTESLARVGIDCQVTETNQWRGAVEIEHLRNQIAELEKILGPTMTAGMFKALMKEIRTNMKVANTKPDPSLLDNIHSDQQDTKSEAADHIGDD